MDHYDGAILVLVIVVAIAVAGLAGVVASGRRADSRRAIPSFLTVNHSGAGATVELQLRRLSNGHVITGLRRTDQSADAVETSQTSALVLISGVCTAKLERVDLLTGSTSVVRRFHVPVDGFALNPAGTKLAYTTYAHCSRPPPCHGECSGPAGFGPDTLAVLDLQTGTVEHTTLKGSIPHPTIGYLAWSPNGRQVAATLLDGTPGQVAVIDADHPDFRTARLLPRPRGCDEADVAWTELGILTDETCGDGSPTLTTHFLALTATGKPVRRWAVPACTYGVEAQPVPGTDKVVVSTDVGYGTCSPQNTWTARFWTIAGNHLKPLFADPGSAFDVTL